jgi:hypothetical protein
MHKTILLLSLFVLLESGDCDQQKQADKIRSLEADVKQLKADVAELKQKPPDHHYELRSEGSRTFRFDPATGDTCIQLTSPADWKRKETKAQSCECIDDTQHYVDMPRATDQEQQWATNYYSFFVKSACGE